MENTPRIERFGKEVGREMSGKMNSPGARDKRCGQFCAGVGLVFRRCDFVRMNEERFLEKASIT